MSIFRRARLYIQRNPVKTIVYVTVLFTMGLFISVAILIQQSTIKVKDDFLATAAPAVTIEIPVEDAAYRNSWYYIKTSKRALYNHYRGIIISVSRRSTVKDWDYSIYTTTYTDCLYPATENWANYFPFSKSSFFGNYIPQLLWGVNKPVFLSLTNNYISVTEGRSFSQQEIDEGSEVCFINENLRVDINGEQHNPQIGEKIPVTVMSFRNSSGNYSYAVDDLFGRETVYLEVIGKFHDNGAVITAGEQSEFYRLYMPAKTLERMHGLQESMNAQRKMSRNDQYDQKDKTALFITDVYFKTESLQTMDDLSLLIDITMSNLVDKEGKPIYSVYNVSDLFSSVSWMIRELEKVADVLLMVAIAVFAVIIVLTNILFMHHRKTELGIYMSLGSRKSSIALQIVVEVLLLALLSFTPAALASKYLADPVSDYLINNVISAKSDAHTTDEMGNTINKVVLIDEEKMQEMYSITVDANTVTRVFLLEIAVTAASALVMIVYTVRISPREVLLRS